MSTREMKKLRAAMLELAKNDPAVRQIYLHLDEPDEWLVTIIVSGVPSFDTVYQIARPYEHVSFAIQSNDEAGGECIYDRANVQ